MPQYSFAPSTDSADNTLGNEGFRQLFNNLSQNVEYRRKMQAAKGAQAAKMRLQQEAGLLPKGNITMTDQGYEFDNEQARNAYYSALGGMMGDQDMSREGGVRSTTSVINDEEQYANDIANANVSNVGPNGENLGAITEDMALITRGIGENQPDILDNPGRRAAFNNDVDSRVNAFVQKVQNTPKKDLSGIGMLAVKMATELAAAKGNQLTPTTEAPGTTAAGKPATATTAPTTPTSSRISASVTDKDRNQVGVNQSVSQRGQASYEYDAGGINVKRDQLAQTTTSKQSARYDDTKTSLKNLLGLSAFSAGADDLSVAAGNQQSTNNPFGAMAQKRANDMLRWEQAASTDGTQQSVEKVGERQITTTGMKAKGSATTQEAMKHAQNIIFAPQQTSSVSTGDRINNGPGNQSPDLAVGALTDANGKPITTTFNRDTNAYELKGVDLSGTAISRWTRIDGRDRPDIKITHQKDGTVRFEDKNGNFLEGRPNPSVKGDYINVRGNIALDVVSQMGLNQGQRGVGNTGTDSYTDPNRRINTGRNANDYMGNK
jgi:hypothetical protein